MYRIVKNTYGDKSVKFVIEKRSLGDHNRWNNITTRDSLDEARDAINTLRNKELVSSEVVE